MRFKIVACINHALALGNEGKLLFHIASDLQNFKSITLGGVVIMGSKTYESLPRKPLVNRVNIVITRNKNYVAEGCIVVHSIEECIELCERKYYDKDCYVIGGGKIYEEFIMRDLVDTMYITEVNNSDEGDTYFPNVLMNKDKWRIFYQTDTQFDRPSKMNYFFRIYKEVKES